LGDLRYATPGYKTGLSGFIYRSTFVEGKIFADVSVHSQRIIIEKTDKHCAKSAKSDRKVAEDGFVRN